MWEAFFAFHISIAQCASELGRRPVVERAMRALAVVLLLPVVQGCSYIIQCSEPVCVEALVAQPSVEALYVTVLHRAPRLDVHQIDLSFFYPAQHAAGGELRSVVRSQVVRHATLLDQSF